MSIRGEGGGSEIKILKANRAANIKNLFFWFIC